MTDWNVVLAILGAAVLCFFTLWLWRKLQEPRKPDPFWDNDEMTKSSELRGTMTDQERREAMRPMTQEELRSRQVAQAQQMRGMSDDELAQRYGDGLLNSYSPDQEPR